MSVGVVISRCQPIHDGHLHLIEKALKENDSVLLVVGSADKVGTDRNPLSIKARLSLVYNALISRGIFDKVEILSLNDWSSDDAIPKQDNVSLEVDNALDVSSEWGMYLYYAIVAKTGEKNFKLYYGDDSSIVSAWFPKYLWDRVTIVSVDRINNISSGYIRQVLRGAGSIDSIRGSLSYLSDVQICRLQGAILHNDREVDLYG